MDVIVFSHLLLRLGVGIEDDWVSVSEIELRTTLDLTGFGSAESREKSNPSMYPMGPGSARETADLGRSVMGDPWQISCSLCP